MRRASLLLAMSTLLTGTALGGQEEDARHAREALGKQGPNALLLAEPNELHYGLHVGSAFAGDMTLVTQAGTVADAAYHLEDRFNFNSAALPPQVFMRVVADLASDLSVRSLTFETSGPSGKGGAFVYRLVEVAPEGGALWLKETVDLNAPVKRKLDVPLDTLILTPPLGVGERLTRLVAPGSGTLSFDGFDLGRNERTVLLITPGDPGKIAVDKGTRDARKIAWHEGASDDLVTWLDPRTCAPLLLGLPPGNTLTAVLEPPEVASKPPPFPDLPLAPLSLETARPVDVVLAFLRTTAHPKPDTAAILSLVDVDALYARAKAPPGDADLQRAFKKILLHELSDDSWRRGDQVKTLADAASPDDWDERISGDRATVVARGLPEDRGFELAREATGWRIVGLPAAPDEAEQEEAPRESPAPNAAPAPTGHGLAPALGFLVALLVGGVATLYFLLKARPAKH